MTNTLIMTIGLPGCGKSTRAMQWVAEDPAGRARVGTDQIADMLHDETRPDEDDVDSTYAELQTTVALQGAIGALLHAGFDVVCDDTNLLPSHVDALRLVAERHHAAVEVWDMTEVDAETCIQRDEDRGLDGGRWVGERRIRYMLDLYRRHQPKLVNEKMPSGGVS
jgi:predicted kinase